MTRRTCTACGEKPAENNHATRCRTCRRHGRRPLQARILVIDIETSPNLAYVWDIWNQNVSIGQLQSTTEVICFAAKWLGEDEVMFWSQHTDGYTVMVDAAWRLLDEADAVIHYNGKRFDVPHLNREFVAAGMVPPKPFRQIDLLSAVKRRFRFPSNKLQYVSTALGLPGKQSHEGFDLWRKCMDGDPDAWARMETYNRQDVILTEELYQILLPWIPGHPNLNLYTEGAGCPSCGGAVIEAGFAYTQLSKFQQYRCTACGALSRGSRRLGGADTRESVL